MISRAERARRSDWPNVEFVCASAHDLSPQGPADVVVFCLSLRLLPHPARAVERALSFTRPGGRWVIVDSIPNADRPLASWVIRAKAGFVGAEPDAFPLTHLDRELEGVTERPLQGRVYSLLVGRKPG